MSLADLFAYIITLSDLFSHPDVLFSQSIISCHKFDNLFIKIKLSTFVDKGLHCAQAHCPSPLLEYDWELSIVYNILCFLFYGVEEMWFLVHLLCLNNKYFRLPSLWLRTQLI